VTAISTYGLSKRFGDLMAVDDLSLAVEPGTLYGFLGPNGAGKSTTIRMLLGLVFPTAGRIELLGQPVGDQLRRVGALVEEPAFWGYLSGRRNLQYHARVSGPPQDRRDRLDRIEEMLQLVGLDEAADKKVKAYSHGMRQRLGIARALLGTPELLVLDEPTTGLDPAGMREVRQLLRSLVDRGITVFVSSHLLAEVEAMCDRVGVLAHGRLVAEGPPTALRPSGNVLRVTIDDPLRAREALAGLDHLDVEPIGAGELRVRLAAPMTAAQVNATLVRAGLAVSAVIPERERLEDVFLALTEGSDAPR
jgi:ABC-2 type transport system ATP-binding protein